MKVEEESEVTWFQTENIGILEANDDVQYSYESNAKLEVENDARFDSK